MTLPGFALRLEDGRIHLFSAEHSMSSATPMTVIVPSRAEIAHVGTEGSNLYGNVDGVQGWSQHNYEVRLDGEVIARVEDGQEIGNTANYSTVIVPVSHAEVSVVYHENRNA